jgi:hypothetical protein
MYLLIRTTRTLHARNLQVSVMNMMATLIVLAALLADANPFFTAGLRLRTPHTRALRPGEKMATTLSSLAASPMPAPPNGDDSVRLSSARVRGGGGGGGEIRFATRSGHALTPQSVRWSMFNRNILFCWSSRPSSVGFPSRAVDPARVYLSVLPIYMSSHPDDL